MTKRGCELKPRAPFCLIFPMSEKKDVLSSPVRVCNAGRAFALSEYIVLQMS